MSLGRVGLSGVDLCHCLVALVDVIAGHRRRASCTALGRWLVANISLFT